MKKSKRLFLLIAAIFLGLILYLSYDISRRTTFPGQQNTPQNDTVKVLENDEYE